MGEAKARGSLASTTSRPRRRARPTFSPS